MSPSTSIPNVLGPAKSISALLPLISVSVAPLRIIESGLTVIPLESSSPV